MKKINSLLNYAMGLLTLVALYQAIIAYPEYGTKLLAITKHPTGYSPTVILINFDQRQPKWHSLVAYNE